MKKTVFKIYLVDLALLAILARFLWEPDWTLVLALLLAYFGVAQRRKDVREQDKLKTRFEREDKRLEMEDKRAEKAFGEKEKLREQRLQVAEDEIKILKASAESVMKQSEQVQKMLSQSQLQSALTSFPQHMRPR